VVFFIESNLCDVVVVVTSAVKGLIVHSVTGKLLLVVVAMVAVVFFMESKLCDIVVVVTSTDEVHSGSGKVLLVVVAMVALDDKVVIVVIIVFLDLITDEDNLGAIWMISACSDNHALFSIEKLDLTTMFALLGA
jgi:hypothetical protein